MPEEENGKQNCAMNKSKEPNEQEDRIKELDKNITEKKNELEKKNGRRVYLFLGRDINDETVTDVYTDLMKNFQDTNGKLDIIMDSGGGDIHAAFNLASLFKIYASKELNVIIPRWAKSAATLVACGADKIFMTPIAELGPLDPQITEMNPIEGRLEEFSPMYIESTLNLIREELKNGNAKLGELLVKRLQFPMTLGGIMKSLEIGGDYLIKLLESRMFKEEKENPIIPKIADKLTKGYCDHGFCINIEEAKNIGLKVSEIEKQDLDIVWDIYENFRKKEKLKRKVDKEDMLNELRDLPEDIRRLINQSILRGKEKKEND